jgi:hypothetical protein
VLVGVSLGLLGGGSILTVPLLAYVGGMDAKHAIATSLLVVGVTSAVGAVSHARAGRVQWCTGAVVLRGGNVNDRRCEGGLHWRRSTSGDCRSRMSTPGRVSR